MLKKIDKLNEIHTVNFKKFNDDLHEDILAKFEKIWIDEIDIKAETNFFNRRKMEEKKQELNSKKIKLTNEAKIFINDYLEKTNILKFCDLNTKKINEKYCIMFDIFNDDFKKNIDNLMSSKVLDYEIFRDFLIDEETSSNRKFMLSYLHQNNINIEKYSYVEISSTFKEEICKFSFPSYPTDPTDSFEENYLRYLQMGLERLYSVIINNVTEATLNEMEEAGFYIMDVNKMDDNSYSVELSETAYSIWNDYLQKYGQDCDQEHDLER